MNNTCNLSSKTKNKNSIRENSYALSVPLNNVLILLEYSCVVGTKLHKFGDLTVSGYCSIKMLPGFNKILKKHYFYQSYEKQICHLFVVVWDCKNKIVINVTLIQMYGMQYYSLLF